MTDFGKLVFIEAGWIHHTVPETAERWDKELALRVAGNKSSVTQTIQPPLEI